MNVEIVQDSGKRCFFMCIHDTKCVFLVEDNPDDEALTLRAINKLSMNCEVMVAHDGAEALRLLTPENEQQGSSRICPDVILLDLKIPKIDGLEVLEKLRSHKRTATVPVVVLTSSSEDTDITASYRKGANSFIRKPIEFDRFMKEMAQVGRYWLSINLSPTPCCPL